ncbi:hypothetical protein QQ045_032871 [Rhodiola kirilowii]
MDHCSGHFSEYTPGNGHQTMVVINSPCCMGIDSDNLCLCSGIGLYTKFSKLLDNISFDGITDLLANYSSDNRSSIAPSFSTKSFTPDILAFRYPDSQRS